MLQQHTYFFHYTTQESAFGHILPEGKLRFSRYMDMRDPLENKHWRLGGASWGGDPQREMAALAKFTDLANHIRERSFLLSMTIDVPSEVETREEEPFRRGWARARMWEQYAENHKGVCLVFKRDLLTDAVCSSLREQEFASPYHRSVIYSGSGMQKPAISENALAGNVTPEAVARYVEDNHDPLFFHKALDWQTEWEYRFSTTSSDKDALLVEVGDSLTHVIVGERFPPWMRPSAITTCEKAGATPLRLDWSMGQPALVELRPLESRRDEIQEAVANVRGAGPPAAPSPFRR